MNKPDSLKAHLLAAVPELRNNGDRLVIFIDNGRVRSTSAESLSFEYAYDLQVILTDFAGHPDSVFLPLLGWLLVNQSDLLANLTKVQDGITFEADLLDRSKVDLGIVLPLTERVVVKRREDGRYDVSHRKSPSSPRPSRSMGRCRCSPTASCWPSGHRRSPPRPSCSRRRRSGVRPMADSLEALEDWAGPMLRALEPGPRAALARSLARDLRRSQQKRVMVQRNPDGSAYEPRKKRELRGKQGRIRRKIKMFRSCARCAICAPRATPRRSPFPSPAGSRGSRESTSTG